MIKSNLKDSCLMLMNFISKDEYDYSKSIMVRIIVFSFWKFNSTEMNIWDL